MTDTTTWSCTRCSTANDPDAPACTGCLTPRPELLALPTLGAFIAAKLREHFPAATERERQVLALAEEAGEFVGAYRRAADMARRTGTWDDVEDELADVAITAYVTAHVLDLDVDDLLAESTGRPIFPAPTGDADTDRRRAALNVSSAVGWFADGYLLDLNPVALGSALHTVVLAVQHAAHVLGIDLPAAVQSKTARILTRGWRDTPTSQSSDTRTEATR
jgi:NTP pyrophosphatase (non-canonical NTP hydrolase)